MDFAAVGVVVVVVGEEEEAERDVPERDETKERKWFLVWVKDWHT